MVDVTFRATGLADREAVEAMLAETYPALLAPDYDADVLALAMPKMVRAQDALLTSGSYFIGHDSGGVAVCAGGWTRAAPGTGSVVAGSGHIRHVVARLDRAGTGVGGALLGHIFGDARGAGMTRLECLSTLTAQAFYARRGFVFDEAIDVPMGEGVVLPSVRMTCRL